MQNNFFKKSIIVLLIFIINLVTFVNCAGGTFPMTRRAIKGIFDFTKDQSKGFRFAKCVVAAIPAAIMMFIAPIIDFVFYNTWEFWTDEQVGQNNYDKEGKAVKVFIQGDSKATLTYTEFGQKLYVDIQSQNEKESFVLLKDQPNKIFKEVDGKLREVGVNEKQIGSKIVLQSTIDGKVKSSKIVDSKEYSQLLSKF
ncbi:MAG: hypothetical protein H7A23_00820 [Leptospiraceae bacterium]|nr:hypothetical protein [Leptospiraceae bacterium]MCP5493072.1 hypothetical protein [Leptospiraceae bacterium]